MALSSYSQYPDPSAPLGANGSCKRILAVIVDQCTSILGVAADLDVVDRGQLFELVDGLGEGLEDLVELDHVGLSSEGKTER